MNSDDSAIRVLLVDDSPIALLVLRRLLQSAGDILVVGTASDGKQALAMLPALNPDVICTDLHMPNMNGLELTQAVMATRPRPILVVSVSVAPGSLNVFRLLEAGAVDFFPKPHAILEADQQKLARELTSKIRIVAGVHVFRTPPASSARLQQPLTAGAPAKLVAIGASTGGPQALHTLLAALPLAFPLPVICVQHIGGNFLTELVDWLDRTCPLPVRLAAQGESPQAGTAYFAPGDSHLAFDESGRFMLLDGPPREGHRPSVTVMMESAAQRFGAGTVGILLTGMGRDGAAGMVEIAKSGGITIAQDEASSIVYGMPQAAVALGGVRQILPLQQIAPALVAMARSGSGTTPN